MAIHILFVALQEQVLSEKLEHEVKTRSAEVAQLKRDAAESLASEREVWRRKCGELEGKVEVADELAASLRARICTLEEEVSSLRKANNILDREIDRERELRNKESEELQSSRLALVSENDELDRRIRALLDELSIARTALKTQEEMTAARAVDITQEAEGLVKRCAKAEEEVVVMRKEVQALRMENSRLVEQLEKEVTHHRNAVDKKDQELLTAAHQNEAELAARRNEAEKLRKQLEGLKKDWVEREDGLKRKMQEKIEMNGLELEV
ncbi:tropomyosin, putative [Perkinsus marinus ATCC 50983]|uniref:Tropomyosin, putative n=1 Tax=Perkinsus marinus (strain ATCC 50983 / TXsc) TaxID=423536 RepID=C5LFB8_PERM5|nr:tropomyosin, putative [Perkinsus marinus ATCC 50983]EER04550.1 tropomyosin, putative [Perkinsus marinus ATCC 50983]|eukprot:XP_002772734.1 tropomyosin, putative [Perkinsus marinus ATCC 50983]